MSRDIRYPAPEPEDTPLSLTLRRRRVELGLTLQQIADRMDVTEATVQRWESGVIKSVRYRRLAKLAEILQVAPAELFPPEARKANPPDDRAADGFEERAARLIQLASRLLPEQKAFLLSVLEEAVRRLPREAPSPESYPPDAQEEAGPAVPADGRSNP